MSPISGTSSSSEMHPPLLKRDAGRASRCSLPETGPRAGFRHLSGNLTASALGQVSTLQPMNCAQAAAK